MNSDNLILLRNTIENLDSLYHLEILRILKEDKVDYTENRNGCFVNVTLLNIKTIEKIRQYLTFIEKQNNHLNITEQLKNTYKIQFFEKDNKDKTNIILNAS